MKSLADVNHGVLSRRQLADLGIGWPTLAANVRARRWRLSGRHAVVLHRGPLTREQRYRVAVEHAGPGALLGGRSALHSLGLRGWDDGRVHVLVKQGRHVPPLPWLTVLYTRRWPEHDGLSAPRCDVARAAVDAAIRLRSQRSAVGILAAVVQQRLALPEWLAEELTAAGRVRHKRLLLSSLGDIAGGSHSVTELDFLQILRRHGLPEPDRQVRRRDGRGRVRYLDAVWTLPDGRTLVVEIDGGLHLEQDTYWSDMARDNEHSLRGDLVLPFPAIALRDDEARVVEQLRLALSPLLAA